MPDTAFKYAPLNSDSQEIRILSIPESRLTEVEFRLEHVSLVGGTIYEALSYTWGDRSDISSIKLNHHPFEITKLLALALERLRRETETNKIWIDAIRINQHDIAERSAQVCQMKEIYEKAKRVVIWVGHESNDSSYAVNAMNSVDRRWATRASQPANRRCITALAVDKRTLQAINHLLCRPWWRRMWIIQEATCANDTYLRCGHDSIEFLAVVATANFMAQRKIRQAMQKDFDSPDIVRFQRVVAPGQLRLARRHSVHSLGFLLLLDISRTCEALDTRDKLFASTGLATSTQREAEKPNYSISIDEAYARLVNTVIEPERNLNVLGHCQQAERNHQS